MVTLAFPLRDLCNSCKLSTLLVDGCSPFEFSRWVRLNVEWKVLMPMWRSKAYLDRRIRRALNNAKLQTRGDSGRAQSAGYLLVKRAEVKETSKDRSLVIM